MTTKENQSPQEQMQEPTDLDCLDAIAELANQLGIDSWSETVQGKEHEAISIARALRGDLQRLQDVEQPHVSVDAKVILTERELEVLRWAALGKSASVTAQILRVNEKTVRKARETAGQKLNAHNITQCLVAATRLGLL
jgi:DNA-binding CsgD family transcriptional regulator